MNIDLCHFFILRRSGLVTALISHLVHNIIYNYIMQNRQDKIYFRPLHLQKDFKERISPLLKEISQKKFQSKELISILQQLHQEYSIGNQSKNYQQKRQKYSFKSLQIHYLSQLPHIMKQLATFLLKYQPQQPIPILRSNVKQKQTYSRFVIFYLITLMFFGIVPYQWTNRPQNRKRINNMNSFGHILSNNHFKTHCIVEYFKKAVKQLEQPKRFQNVYIIYRNICEDSIDTLIKANERQPLVRMMIEQDNASIQDFNGHLKVDFANRFIGGGCLRNGCVQQQIMFATRPQLMALTLLCEKMQPYEALAFSGFKRYFNYSGYADRTRFEGQCIEEYYLEGKEGQKYYSEHIVAIDAIKFKKDDLSQFEKRFLDREIQKAYAGFSTYREEKKIITGGWGCGVYNGDFVTKLIIQWIAASLARKQIVVCPFGRKRMLMNSNFFGILDKLTVGQLYDVLIEGGKMKIKENSREGILKFIRYLIK